MCIRDSLRRAFEKVDKDNSGTLEQDEVKAGVSKMAAIVDEEDGEGALITEEELDQKVTEIFVMVDSNQDGMLSFEEVVEMVLPGEWGKDGLEAMAEDEWNESFVKIAPMVERFIST
eukprot:TRINITY_DN561_c0_g2_i2.p1 TRINITY_DN561_c0_g2~~TRINITY_DN561_c0_g2_i2.p1  ORF type:complete len:117 (-),score=55.53 TRINITY_DN561_c0_g2_i2:226-576(-)